VLNQGTANNFRGMVCAFLTSTEYQRRFSPVVTHNNSDCAGATAAQIVLGDLVGPELLTGSPALFFSRIDRWNFADRPEKKP
jgi:hypothetical protein